ESPTWYPTINARRTPKARAKSTMPDRTEASGTTRRGKYTFFKRLALPTRLFDAWVSAFAKNVHGTRAANAKIGYGTPSEGIFARWPKKTANTIIVKPGWMMAQAAPSTVCLYRTWMSRQTRK